MLHFPHFYFYLPAILPVIAVSCSFVEEHPSFSADELITPTRLLFRRAGDPSNQLENATVFIYNNDDGEKLLETWQDIDLNDEESLIYSTNGNKIAVFVANRNTDMVSYEEVGSMESLKNFCSHFSEEDPAAPVMTGKVQYKADGDYPVAVRLAPLLAKVCISSFLVDFDGQGYNGSYLEDTRVYITNINGYASVLGTAARNREILNQGGLDPFFMKKFSHPEMVYSGQVHGAQLYCYPNASDGVWEGEEVHPTRLVIEGRIDGETYYYPIRIGNSHVEAGANYEYRIKIKRKGTTDPEIDADAKMVECELVPVPWNEKKLDDEIF